MLSCEYSDDEQNEWVLSGKEEEEDDSWIADCEDETELGNWDPNGEFVGKDYSEYFITNLRWDNKEELFEWAKDKGKELMIVLVTHNSSPYQISMVCDRFGKPRSGRPKVNIENSDLPVPMFRNTKSKKCGCRFELMGVREKKEQENPSPKWVLGVMEGRHNHNLFKSLHGSAYVGRMKLEEELLARRWGDGCTTPKQIVGELRKSFPGNVTSRKTVANFLQKMHYEDRGELTVTQWSLKFLVDNEYVVYPLRDRRTDEVEIFFFANKESLRLMKKFLYVIIINVTYKTNK